MIWQGQAMLVKLGCVQVKSWGWLNKQSLLHSAEGRPCRERSQPAGLQAGRLSSTQVQQGSWR